jgi:hypothetical protein
MAAAGGRLHLIRRIPCDFMRSIAMSLVQIFRREANRLREMAAALASDEARADFLSQARHYDVLASQAASRQLPARQPRTATH